MKFFGTLGSELSELKKFESLKQEEKKIVFYSENQNSTFIFESLINELINVYDIDICYVTSSKTDPFLKISNKKIKTFCIGEGAVRTKFFLNLQAGILIMTMPDLETLYIKRSKICPVHYVCIFHAMVSTHLMYRKNAFDHFDSIFCVGKHQIDEIKSTEKFYHLKPKRLIEFGYNHLDNLIEKYSKNENFTLQLQKHIQVLIAPSWGKDGIFETISEEIIDILLDAKYKVILRPHPMTQKKSKQKISYLEKKFSSNPNFVLELDIPNFDSFSQSHVMISDWSGVAFEFAFAFERPILYVDVPKKMHNPDFEDIQHVPIEESIRDKIGTIIPKSEIEFIPKYIEKLCKESKSMKEQIKKIREETIFNIGKSNKIGAEQIIEILNQLKDRHSQDKSNQNGK